jgi:hypothetical protein
VVCGGRIAVAVGTAVWTGHTAVRTERVMLWAGRVAVWNNV